MFLALVALSFSLKPIHKVEKFRSKEFRLKQKNQAPAPLGSSAKFRNGIGNGLCANLFFEDSCLQTMAVTT
jgi:hypothetical protein